MEKLRKWWRMEMDVEFLACVHGMSFVLVFGFLLWLTGDKNVSFAIIFQMVMLGYVISWFQKLMFLKDRVYKKLEYAIRSVLWCVGPVFMVLLCQQMFSWFAGRSWWVLPAFDIVMLMYFTMVCIFVHIFYRRENEELNQLLKEFQNRRG